MANWRTSITHNEAGEIRLHGYDLTELMGSLSFSQTIFLALRGTLPNEQEAVLLDALLVSMIDAGIAPPSAVAARVVYSGGNSFNSSVAAGLLASGDWHGGAIEACARIFQETLGERGHDDPVDGDDPDLALLARGKVAEFRENKKRFPGYGHKLHKERDPRAQRLIQITEKLGLAGDSLMLALLIEHELHEQTGRSLPLNVDGCTAAIISDLGFDWRLGKAFFLIARTPGLCAHVMEEAVREKPFRRLAHDEHVYDGVEPRSLTEQSE